MKTYKITIQEQVPPTKPEDYTRSVTILELQITRVEGITYREIKSVVAAVSETVP